MFSRGISDRFPSKAFPREGSAHAPAQVIMKKREREERQEGDRQKRQRERREGQGSEGGSHCNLTGSGPSQAFEGGVADRTPHPAVSITCH